MLIVPRSVLKRFRTLCRRGGLHKFKTGDYSTVTFVGSQDGLRIRCQSPEVAVEYRQTEPCQAEAIRIPLDALDVCEGRDESAVTIEGGKGKQVLLSWNDGGVPRQHEVEQPKGPTVGFPEIPAEFTANEPELWRALKDAVATRDESSARYALGCLHLRGRDGSIEATDGRQVLVQAGYRFGFTDDVLVPGSKLLGCNDMDVTKGIGVGRAGEWIGFQAGDIVMLLHVQKDARFPKVDQILPNANRATSRLELSGRDATFLTETLPKLPSDDPVHQPVTLDLNGKVCLRCRVVENGRPTEIVLPSSKLIGEPVLLNMNRTYLERALKLGFAEVRLYGPNSPALCLDRRRQYLWALLDQESAIKPTAEAVRIEPSTAPAPLRRIHHHKEPTMTVSSAAPTKPRVRAPLQSNPASLPIEQTIALRDALRTAARQANDLVRSLKRQKRQSRIVESTSVSLKQPQKVAG